MKKMLLMTIIVFCLFSSLITAKNTTYKISDNKDYQNLIIKLQDRSLILSEGDSVLFKRGETYSGYLKIIEAKGSAKKPVVISSYGTGPKPVINGKGTDQGCIFIKNSENIEVNGLYLENASAGVNYTADTMSILKNIRIYNCYIGNCYGGSGIRIICPFPTKWTEVKYPNTILENIIVENNEVMSNTFYGILVGNSNNRFDKDSIDCSFEKVNWFNNVKIRYNKISKSQCNGIVVFGAENSLVEYNIIDSTGIGKLDNPNSIKNGNGIVISAAKNIVIQHNKVSNVQYSYRAGHYTLDENNNEILIRGNGDGDAGGISIDLLTKDILCQNNLFINNGMNGIAVMTLNYKNPKTGKWIFIPNIGAIVRNNVCINNSELPKYYDPELTEYKIYTDDSLKYFNPSPESQWLQRSGEIRISGPVDNCQIYDNTFVSNSSAVQMISQTNWNGYPKEIQWSNNSFYSDNPNIRYEYLGGPNIFNNNYFNFSPKFIKNEIKSSSPTDDVLFNNYLESPVLKNNIIK